ncbi:MAG TPA: imelysin family protein [Kofleriaceae bacterium]|jgi:iron uptake system component EfeO
MKKLVFVASTLSLLAACGGDGSKSDGEFKTETVNAMHDSIASDLADIGTNALALQAAAPTHAWTQADAAAITAMKDAWKKTRVSYEHVEGATAPIFADFDFTMDARYDNYLTELGATGDQNLFDDQGATGMHSIERILYAPEIRQEVIDFESTLPGYKAAAWPATDAEAMDFKTKLLQKLVDDANDLHDQWTPAAIDIGAAFQGLVGLMNEQKEKVNLAATGEEESRYANITLFDLRNNLAGTKKIYDLFVPWIEAKNGTDPNESIQTHIGELVTLYGTSPDALPVVPADWSSDQPTPANLATPFGMMWKTIHDEVDPNSPDSIVSSMNDCASLLGFPEFVEQ